MNRIAIIALVAAAALSAQTSSKRPVSLFDGKTLTGWEARSTSEPDSKGDWKVERGSLVCGGEAPGWIATTQTYSNFRLTLEFRGKQDVNSGIFLRSQKEGQPHVTGYELQIWDEQPAGYHTGSLVGSVKATRAKIRGNKWNKYDITANGNHFIIVLNGTTLLDTRDSKHSSGVIGFQCQKDQKIEFRNIKLQTLGG